MVGSEEEVKLYGKELDSQVDDGTSTNVQLGDGPGTRKGR